MNAKQATVPGMRTEVPKPQPVRHTRRFNREEIIAALTLYLQHNSVSVPEGKTNLWGLDELVLVIDESVT